MKTRTSGFGIIALGVLTLASAAAAPAEPPARSMAALEGLLRPGTHVDVVDRQGRILRGEFVRADEDGVLVAPYRATEGRRVPAGEILTVTRHGDSLKSGALIGLATGVITAMAVITDDYGDYGCDMTTTGCKAALSVFAVGASTGIGMFIDHEIKGRHLVYRAPADRISWSVTPHPVPRGAGIQLGLRF